MPTETYAEMNFRHAKEKANLDRAKLDMKERQMRERSLWLQERDVEKRAASDAKRVTRHQAATEALAEPTVAAYEYQDHVWDERRNGPAPATWWDDPEASAIIRVDSSVVQRPS